MAPALGAGAATELGLPGPYDYGGMRETWLCHLLTDWIGEVHVAIRCENQRGEVTTPGRWWCYCPRKTGRWSCLSRPHRT